MFKTEVSLIAQTTGASLELVLHTKLQFVEKVFFTEHEKPETGKEFVNTHLHTIVSCFKHLPTQ